MPDMRYELRISANEMLGTTQVLVVVVGHPHEYSHAKSERLYRRLFEVPAEPDAVERWVRDVLVGVAEYL